jgi:hypothetical protein
VILPQGLLRGQSDRADLAPGFGLAPPRMVPPPEPTHPWPRLPVAPPGTIGLPQLTHAAGMIFSATVTSIARRPATGGQAIATVAITLHVENVIRGATPSENLTITQWMGLWSSGQRYRIGERALLFLYPLSKVGLTSCVGGPMGRFNLDPLGRVLLSAQQISAFRRDPVLGGKSRVSFRDFALAVQLASEEE